MPSVSRGQSRSLGYRSLTACAIGVAMIAAYVVAGTYLKSLPAVEALLASVASSGSYLGIASLWIVLFACFMLPFSSAALFILLGLDFYGAVPVFWTALSAGLLATATSYAIGRNVAGVVSWPRLRDPIEEARQYLAPRTGMVGILTLSIKAVPNPMYDAWGYACGVLGVSFRVYFVSAIAGGLLPLSFLCFGLEKFL